jgi:hypothetical protein
MSTVKYLKKVAGVDAPVRVDVAPVFGEVSATSDYFLNGLWYDSTGTVYNPQPTYLNHNGKLVGFEVANGDVVDLHYDIDYPKIVEDVIQVDTMIADEYKGKNACTAWVNFDGTTTPPTIKDSYNVSDVVKSGDVIEVVYNQAMDNLDYSFCSGMVANSTNYTQENIKFYDKKVGSIKLLKTYMDIGSGYSTSPSANMSVHIFGGKN